MHVGNLHLSAGQTGYQTTRSPQDGKILLIVFPHYVINRGQWPRESV